MCIRVDCTWRVGPGRCHSTRAQAASDLDMRPAQITYDWPYEEMRGPNGIKIGKISGIVSRPTSSAHGPWWRERLGDCGADGGLFSHHHDQWRCHLALVSRTLPFTFGRSSLKRDCLLLDLCSCYGTGYTFLADSIDGFEARHTYTHSRIMRSLVGHKIGECIPT